MATPNLFLIYVKQIDRSVEFYSNLFDIEPQMVSPRYAAFEVAPGVLFALWTGRADGLTPQTPRTSEVGYMVPGGGHAVDRMYDEWLAKGAASVEAPYDDVFGRTCLVADPDGNLIRISPVD